MEDNKEKDNIESREEQAAKAAVQAAKIIEEATRVIDNHEEIDDNESELYEDTEASEDKIQDIKSKKKDSKDEKISELNDRLIRNMAEFDNYRKRTEKEKSSMFDMGVRSTVEKLLPIVDNFERGLDKIPEDKDAKVFIDGMEMIHKQLLKNLEDLGVTYIDCVGKEFNPDFHNAVMHVEDENLGENIVADELQKGYMYKTSVVRHSMVKVAN